MAGYGYRVILNRTGRQFNYILNYVDNSPGFRAEVGFIPRVDVRDVSQQAAYLFRPEGEHLISWGPAVFTEQAWDHTGLMLDDHYALAFQWNFQRQTFINVTPFELHNERLRPQDFSGLSFAKTHAAFGINHIAAVLPLAFCYNCPPCFDMSNSGSQRWFVFFARDRVSSLRIWHCVSN